MENKAKMAKNITYIKRPKVSVEKSKSTSNIQNSCGEFTTKS